MPRIKNMGTATMQFKEGIIVTGSAHNPNGTDSAYSLIVSGSAYVDEDIKLKGKLDVIASDVNNDVAIEITAANNDVVAMRFGNNANDFGYNLIYSGTATGNNNAFTIQTDGGSGGAADVEALKMLQDGSTFIGESGMLTVTGSRVGIGTTSPSNALHVQGNVSDYVAIIDNDQNSSGHVLKLLTDGNGSGTRVLEMEDGDGDIIFRARADGRFGFGPDGVSSMGAGTFVVGIDNSSHTSDIAISKRLQHLGDSNTYIDFPDVEDKISLTAGGYVGLVLDESASGVDRVYLGGPDDDTAVVKKYAQVLVMSGGSGASPNEANYSDTNFFVSGSIGSRGTTTKGTAVFGGDLFVSGGLITDDKLGVGTSNPQAELQVQSVNDDGDIILSRFDSNIQNNDTLGTVHFAGTENGTTWGYGARIAAIASGDWSVGSDIPTNLVFYTTNDGVGSATQKMVIADDGNVGIGLISRDEAKLRVTGSILIETDSNNSKPNLIFHNNDNGLVSGATLGKISFSNFPSPTSNESAIIEVQTDGSYASNTKSKMFFKTSDGSNPPAEVMRIEDNTVMIGQPSSATSGFDLSVQGPTYINDTLSAASVTARSRLITDEIQSKTASQQLINWDSVNQELEIGAGATVSTVIESGGGRPLYADRTATYGQIRIGTVDGEAEHSAFDVSSDTGLYVEGFNNSDTIATFVNRSVNTNSDGITIIIGKGGYSNSVGGVRSDEPGTTNSFLKFKQKNKGSSGSGGDPDGILTCATITGDGSGGVVYNTSFTGKHFSVISKADAVLGFIVKSTGKLLLENEVSTALPSIALANSIKDKRVYGVIGNIGTGVEGYKYNLTIKDNEQDVDINSLGEGKIWVTNISGNIENGDYITSSNIAGYGMLQDDDILHNYTVAKCTQAIDWSTITDTIDHEGIAYKKYLIACTYHCG